MLRVVSGWKMLVTPYIQIEKQKWIKIPNGIMLTIWLSKASSKVLGILQYLKKRYLK